MTPYIIGQSKAIYSTWFYFPTYNLMFDCGDGASNTLGIHSSDIKYIFLSHFHADHYLGLFGIANFLKRTTKKVKRKIIVYYHNSIKDNIISIENSLKNLELDEVLEFRGFEFNEKINIGNNKFVLPFEVNHTAKYYKTPITACGFSICEERKKLNLELSEKIKELSNLEKANFIKSISNDNKYEFYTYKYVTYCGDSLPINFDEINQTEILMHECTFLTKKECDAAHTDLESLIEKINGSNIKFNKIILYHLTEKYIREDKEYKEKILKQFKNNIEIVEINKIYKLFK